MEIAKVNATRQKKTKRGGGNYPVCLVCGRLCLFRHYYGVICCEGCKKFFHRNASQDSSAPQCVNDSPCDVTKVKCRYCRYQKCLLVGMDPNFGKMKSAEKFDCFIECLKRIEQQFKRIWDSTRPLPEAYTNRHETLAGLLHENFNLLANADQFPEEPFGCWNKVQFIEDVETNGLFGLHALNLQFIKDWFLLVELAKTFPFIKKLEPNDQICHLKHVDLPARLLISAFYSYSMNAKCYTRKNGLEIPAVLDVKQIHGDQRLRTLLLKCSLNLIDKMSKTDVNYEEFLLLLTILLSNSNADGLSPIGRKQLYNESVNYSKTLQNMLQCKFGPIGGAQKFASLMDVLNLAIGLKFQYFSLFTYMEVFYTKCALDSAYPKIMHSI